jgi:hypothetical protein
MKTDKSKQQSVIAFINVFFRVFRTEKSFWINSCFDIKYLITFAANTLFVTLILQYAVLYVDRCKIY